MKVLGVAIMLLLTNFIFGDNSVQKITRDIMLSDKADPGKNSSATLDNQEIRFAGAHIPLELPMDDKPSVGLHPKSTYPDDDRKAATGAAQNQNTGDKTDTALISAAREIMNKAGTCTLITLDAEGLPDARVMDPFYPEEDLTVWFGTNPRSRKVNQITQNPNVTLFYFDRETAGYVVIHGIARLVNDPDEKKNRWKEAWEDFYPDRDEDYLLIQVSPEWMEILSEAKGITGDPVTWQVPVVNFKKK
ncbi:MAG: pyridoxamine 5'-phosphate oxidase family protein [bacterium]